MAALARARARRLPVAIAAGGGRLAAGTRRRQVGSGRRQVGTDRRRVPLTAPQRLPGEFPARRHAGFAAASSSSPCPVPSGVPRSPGDGGSRGDRHPADGRLPAPTARAGGEALGWKAPLGSPALLAAAQPEEGEVCMMFFFFFFKTSSFPLFQHLIAFESLGSAGGLGVGMGGDYRG